MTANGTNGRYALLVEDAPPLPHDLGAEQAVLGSILLNRDALVAVAPWLRAEHFYLAKHAWIYQAMLDLYQRRIPPDMRTVSDTLRRHGRLEAVGGVMYLAELLDQVPTSYHIEHYARAVERTGVLRQLIAAGSRVAALGFEEGQELEDTLARAETAVLDIAQKRATRDFVPLGEVFDGLFQQITAMQEHRGEVVGVPTGFRDLDTLLGGLQKSDLLVLAGRPGSGKTACAMSMAYQIAEAGRTVGVFSLEMSGTQLAQRLLAIDTGIDTHRLRNNALRDAELEGVLGAMGRMAAAAAHRGLGRDDAGGATLEGAPAAGLEGAGCADRRLPAARSRAGERPGAGGLGGGARAEEPGEGPGCAHHCALAALARGGRAGEQGADPLGFAG
jgi:replicative DNA helicase